MKQTGQSSGTGTQQKRNVMISNIEELSKLAKGDSVEEVVAAVRLAAAEKKNASNSARDRIVDA